MMRTKMSECTPGDARDKKIEGTAWGLLFLWIGVALLRHFSWGTGLVGIGAITLAAQVWRNHVGVRVHGFSVVLGGVFAISGLLNLFQLNVDLVPLLFLLGGIILLVLSWKDGNRLKQSSIGSADNEEDTQRSS